MWGKSGGDIALWAFYSVVLVLHFFVTFYWIKKWRVFLQLLAGLILGLIINITSFNIVENNRVNNFYEENPYYNSPYLDSDSSSYSYSFKRIELLDKNTLNFRKIKRLNLANTQLTNLPKFINNFDSLVALDLAVNPGLNIDSVILILTKINTLKELNLTNCNLSYLPNELSLLSNLERIELSMNPELNVDTIVARLSKMNNLKMLYLGQNKIEILPESFKELNHLEFLFLRGNKLKAIPSVVDSLPKLSELYIGNNEFSIKEQNKRYRINN